MHVLTRNYRVVLKSKIILEYFVIFYYVYLRYTAVIYYTLQHGTLHSTTLNQPVKQSARTKYASHIITLLHVRTHIARLQHLIWFAIYLIH